ncbi:hypothetical protein Lal_00020507 [Lupinus albus]|nr:hypothetical protein Lal_00020507 [Lupinus albus]
MQWSSGSDGFAPTVLPVLYFVPGLKGSEISLTATTGTIKSNPELVALLYPMRKKTKGSFAGILLFSWDQGTVTCIRAAGSPYSKPKVHENSTGKLEGNNLSTFISLDLKYNLVNHKHEKLDLPDMLKTIDVSLVINTANIWKSVIQFYPAAVATLIPRYTVNIGLFASAHWQCIMLSILSVSNVEVLLSKNLALMTLSFHDLNN